MVLELKEFIDDRFNEKQRGGFAVSYYISLMWKW
jgi:hypothetical protein